jgi:hypothetical protein
VFIDPANTNWIAWNNADDLLVMNSGCSVGEVHQGRCLRGNLVDDEIFITVINPSGGSLGRRYDFSVHNNVIFGAADAAPDVFRSSSDIVDEAGLHDFIFTESGIYQFRFSWQNAFTGPASHPDTYLLVDVVPEPATALLLGLGLVGIAAARRRRSLH